MSGGDTPEMAKTRAYICGIDQAQAGEYWRGDGWEVDMVAPDLPREIWAAVRAAAGLPTKLVGRAELITRMGEG